jgi:hypothetical protein
MFLHFPQFYKEGDHEGRPYGAIQARELDILPMQVYYPDLVIPGKEILFIPVELLAPLLIRL